MIIYFCDKYLCIFIVFFKRKKTSKQTSMPLSRTLSMYNVFSSKEKKELNNVMAESSKHSLQMLHNIVRSPKKTQKITNKAELFKELFGYEYTKKKDFLLRNEIRIYNASLKKIISTTHFEQNNDFQQQAFINELEKRALDDILRFELNKKIAEEEKSNSFFNLISLYEKQIQLKKKSLNFSSTTFSDFKELHQLALANKLNFIGESISNTAYHLAYTERVLVQLSQQSVYTRIIDNTDLFKDVFTQNLAFLNSLKTKAFQLNGNDKVSVLKEILTFLETTKFNKIDIIIETVSAQQSLATENMLLGKYDTAISYFELCLAQKTTINKNFQFGLNMNYVSALVKARKFEKASLFIIENALHKSGQSVKRMLPVFIITFILDNKIVEAESLMPLKFDKEDLDYYHYLRLLHCIILYENKLFELANNEAENLKQHLTNFKDKSNEMDNIISDFIISFIRIEFQNTNQKKILKRKKLRENLLRFAKQNKDFDSDSLIIIWLNKQLLIQE